MANMSEYAVVTEIVKKCKEKPVDDDDGDDDNEYTH